MADLNRVTVWAKALIALHLDPNLWSFSFDHAKKRAGLCNFTEHRISVSRYLAAKFKDDEIHQVLLHEVAHAIAGSKAGHGPKWKKIADELGYDGSRTHDGEIASELAPWLGFCQTGHKHFRYQRPTQPLSCSLCARNFRRENIIVWIRRTPEH